MKLKIAKGPYWLFLISPIIALVYGLKLNQKVWAKNMLWLFIIFYGFTMVIDISQNYDSTRYAIKFLMYREQNFTLTRFFEEVFSGSTGYVDLAAPLITIVVAQFTENYHFLFAVFGLFFGYFYSRNLWFLFELTNGRIKKYSIILLVAFAMVIVISEINVFRWMTASQVFMLGLLHYFFKKKRTGLLIATASIFFHFTFLLAVIVLIIYHFAGNRRIIYFGLYAISMFFVQLDHRGFDQYLTVLPDVFEDRYSPYLVDPEDYKPGRAERGPPSLLKTAQMPAINYSIFILISIILLLRKKLGPIPDSVENIFSFSMLFLGVFNLLFAIPSMHRFAFFGRAIALASIFLLAQHEKPSEYLKKPILFLSPFISIYIIYRFRAFIEFAPLLTFWGNPIIAPFFRDDMRIVDFLRSIFS